jgi:hypothetical protein
MRHRVQRSDEDAKTHARSARIHLQRLRHQPAGVRRAERRRSQGRLERDLGQQGVSTLHPQPGRRWFEVELERIRAPRNRERLQEIRLHQIVEAGNSAGCGWLRRRECDHVLRVGVVQVQRVQR